jgi:hypothetical protein
MWPPTHWLAYRVQPLKKQIHLGWEYSGLQDLTRETLENITPELLRAGALLPYWSKKGPSKTPLSLIMLLHF